MLFRRCLTSATNFFFAFGALNDRNDHPQSPVPPEQPVSGKENHNRHSKRETLHKYEILRGQKLTERLFAQGKSLREGSLKIMFLWQPAAVEQEVPFVGLPDSVRTKAVAKGLPRVVFAVSKRTLRRAVQRNRVKRQLREAYRKERNIFLAELNRKSAALNGALLTMAFIYQGRREKSEGSSMTKEGKRAAEKLQTIRIQSEMRKLLLRLLKAMN